MCASGWEVNHCWTRPDASHQVQVCWIWMRTLPFNPLALFPSHFLMCGPQKCCEGSSSRQPEGPLRPVLPPAAHSTHLQSSKVIMRRTQTSWWAAQSAQRTDPMASLSVASLPQICCYIIKAFLLVLCTNYPYRYLGFSIELWTIIPLFCFFSFSLRVGNWCFPLQRASSHARHNLSVSDSLQREQAKEDISSFTFSSFSLPPSHSSSLWSGQLCNTLYILTPKCCNPTPLQKTNGPFKPMEINNSVLRSDDSSGGKGNACCFAYFHKPPHTQIGGSG